MELNTENATLAELESLDLETLMGGDVESFETSSNLPDGLYGFVIEKSELKRFPADVEKNKKARVNQNIQLKVVQAIECDDPDVDKEKLAGRMHFESYDLLSDYGKQSMVKFVLGVLGISFTDKKAWKEVISSFAETFMALEQGAVQFACQVKTVERNGYTNTNLQLKPKAFIDAEKYAEMAE